MPPRAKGVVAREQRPEHTSSTSLPVAGFSLKSIAVNAQRPKRSPSHMRWRVGRHSVAYLRQRLTHRADIFPSRVGDTTLTRSTTLNVMSIPPRSGPGLFKDIPLGFEFLHVTPQNARSRAAQPRLVALGFPPVTDAMSREYAILPPYGLCEPLGEAMRSNHSWVFWTLLLAPSLLTTAPAAAQTQEPQRGRTAQNCPSFNFDECLNACDRKMGAANPENLGCAQLCKQSKDNCSAGRSPVDNPYLREGSAPSTPDDAKTAPSLEPSTPPPLAPQPAVTAPPPTNTPAQTFRNEDNQDIDGMDLGKFKNTDLEACASACNGEPQCQVIVSINGIAIVF